MYVFMIAGPSNEFIHSKLSTKLFLFCSSFQSCSYSSPSSVWSCPSITLFCLAVWHCLSSSRALAVYFLGNDPRRQTHIPSQTVNIVLVQRKPRPVVTKSNRELVILLAHRVVFREVFLLLFIPGEKKRRLFRLN